MLISADASVGSAWLRDQLARMAPDHAIGRVRTEKVFPSGQSSVCYRAELIGSGDIRPRDARITVSECADPSRRRRLLGRLRRSAKSVRRRDQTVPVIVGEVPSRGLLIYSFPLDPKLPRLHEASAPAAAASIIDRLGIPRRPGSAVQVDIVRYVPQRRCQMRWTYTEDLTQRHVYAKAYRDRRGHDVSANMARLHGWAKRFPSAGIAMPPPLGVADDWNVMVQEAVEGETLHRLITTGRARPVDLERAGRALAVVHAAPVDPGHEHTAQGELEVVRRQLALAERHADPPPALAGLLVELEEAFRRGSVRGRSALVHGDCYDRQFVMTRRCAALIDLDGMTRGAPELDVANVFAHLSLRVAQGVLDQAEANRWRGHFLEGYAQLSTLELLPHLLALYRVTALVRLAALYALRSADIEVPRRLTTCALQPSGPAAAVRPPGGRG